MGEFQKNKYEKAVAALLSCQTMQEAAKKSRVNKSTLQRWLASNEEFQELFSQAKKALIQQALTQVLAATGEAVVVLKNVMTNEENPPSSRVAAARVILDTALKVASIEELQERVEQLEKLLMEKDEKVKKATA